VGAFNEKKQKSKLLCKCNLKDSFWVENKILSLYIAAGARQSFKSGVLSSTAFENPAN
jgi:hypothetical protein